MRKITKALLLVCCAVLLVVGSVVGTLAYLTSTDSVTNTFTLGNVSISLDESNVDEYGNSLGGTRVKANEYKLIPGHIYTKDPTVHVSSTSEDSWLFVKVQNGINSLETPTGNTITSQMAANGWTLVNGTTDVYAYPNKVQKNADVKVFETFAIDGSATYEQIKAAGDAKIVITAYAIQADGFATSAEAFNALKSESGITI